MKNNLVAKVMTDKNGVTTKRWVKPFDQSSKKTNLPAPTTMGSGRRLLVDQLAEAFKEFRYGKERGNYDDLEEDTLNLILREHAREPMRSSIINHWLERHAGNESMVRELNTFAYVFDRDSDSDFIESTMNDLRQYDELPDMHDYSKADLELQGFIAGLLKITEALYSDIWNNGYGDDGGPVTIVFENPTNVPTMIDDPDLQRLIFDHPDKVHLICKVITDRGTKDPEAIREVIMSDALALGEGVL